MEPVIPHQTPPAPPNTRPCAEPTCTVRVPTERLCCPPHWARLPADLRTAIGEAYRERRRHPIPHLRAVGAARQWMKANPPPL
jgi:hypothetical protein